MINFILYNHYLHMTYEVLFALCAISTPWVGLRAMLFPFTLTIFAIQWIIGVVVALSAYPMAYILGYLVNDKGDLPIILQQLYQPVLELAIFL